MSSPNMHDDYFHTPSRSQDWRESYYFNFVDADSGISSFSTIGLLPNLGKREFVFALFYGDKKRVYYNEISGKFKLDLDSLSDGHLTFELIEPLNLWRINFLDKDLYVELLWKARFCAYFFGRGSGTSWAEHFEQSGLISGVVHLPDNKKIMVKGFGQRDKSWGSRQWHIENWFALHAQFDCVSIGLRKDTVKGKTYIAGGISSELDFKQIKSVETEVEQVDNNGVPVKSRTIISAVDGSTYTLLSSLISPNSYVRFSRSFHGGVTELFEGMATHYCEELDQKGTGLLEWLFTKFNWKSNLITMND